MDKATAISFFGTQADMARALGVSRSAVWQWADPIPEPRSSHVIATIKRLQAERTRIISKLNRAAVRVTAEA